MDTGACLRWFAVSRFDVIPWTTFNFSINSYFSSGGKKHDLAALNVWKKKQIIRSKLKLILLMTTGERSNYYSSKLFLKILTALVSNAEVKPILLKATLNSAFIVVRQTNMSSVFNEKFTPSSANLQWYWKKIVVWGFNNMIITNCFTGFNIFIDSCQNKTTVKTTNFKRNSSGRRRMLYMNIPPPPPPPPQLLF